MRKPSSKWIILICTVLFVGFATTIVVFLYEPASFYIIRELSNPNSINVITKDDLDPLKVKITWNSEFKNENVLYEEGRDLKKRYKEYGANRFKVFYNDVLIESFGHFKTNNWHGHSYNFTLQKKEGEITCSWHVIGPNGTRD